MTHEETITLIMETIIKVDELKMMKIGDQDFPEAGIMRQAQNHLRLCIKMLERNQDTISLLQARLSELEAAMLFASQSINSLEEMKYFISNTCQSK